MASSSSSLIADAPSSIGTRCLPPSGCIPTPMERGIALFNQNLTTDTKKRIGPTLASNKQHLPCTIETLLKDAEKCRDSHVGNRSAAQARIANVLININRHAKVIDVLIQQQPDITALVWGGFRFLIGVAAIEIDTSEKIAQTLLQIVQSLGCWNKYLELFKKSERVREAAAHLFSQIINFLVRARIFYQKSRPVRYLKVGFSTYSLKLDEIMSVIRDYEHILEREARLASEIELEQDRRARDKQIMFEREEFKKQNEFRNQSLTHYDKIQGLFQRESLERESEKVHEWLCQSQHRPFIVPRAEDGTCRWIQRSKSWSTWVINNYDMPLWIFGVPGCGKSTIADYLAQSATTSIVMKYSFQATIHKEKSTSATFAAAVLYYLLQEDAVKSCSNYPLAVEKLCALSKYMDVAGETAFQPLWEVILTLASTVANFTLVVDGLDESDTKSVTKLCMELIRLASVPGARVVVFSRYRPSLGKIFHSCPKMEVTVDATLKDVRLFISAEVQRNPTKLAWFHDEIIEVISHTSQGMFLYAVLMLTTLKNAVTRNEQCRCLQQPPPTLHVFYESLLSDGVSLSNPNSLAQRREIFVILVGVSTPLTCEEVSFVLGLRDVEQTHSDEFNELIEPEEAVLSLCWPLVTISKSTTIVKGVTITKSYAHFIHGTVKDYLTRPSPDFSSSIGITSDESESYLASKSLAALSQDEYRSPNKIASLIRRNVESVKDRDEDKYFYQYAATHWFLHLTAVRKPETSLLQQAAQFLRGNEFVSWSEFLFQISGSQGKVLEAESRLKIWQKSLPDDLEDSLPLIHYYECPYRAAAKAFEGDAGDKVLPYLCLYQLGEYYNLAARTEEAFQVKRTVAEGLVALLGERHPLALKAQSAFALEYMGQRRFNEAEKMFNRLAQIQKEVLGVDLPDFFQSRQRQGMAELWMTKFSEADRNLTESLSGLYNTVGVRDFLYLLSQLTMAQVLEYQGQIERATLDYEHIWRYRSSILGPDNPMAVWARCALVSTYRKLRRFEEAERAVSDVIEARTRTIGPKLSPTVDAIIQQAVLYLDSDKFGEAAEVVDFLLDGGLVDEWFERAVQVDHVRALLELFAGNVESTIEILQSLVLQSLEIGEDGRVRSLLWVRLDLATLLRRVGREDEALMLFDDFVTRVDSDTLSSWVKPRAPAEMIVVEKALRLIRNMKLHDAKLLLEDNGLKWVRLEDFWILNGSPPADTSCMKKP